MYICITKWGKLVLQIGEALFYYKLGRTLLHIRAASLLQIRASVVTNWGSYYKLGQPLLQDKAAITNWSKMYYKLGQVLQIRAIVTYWGTTTITVFNQVVHRHCNISMLYFITTSLIYFCSEFSKWCAIFKCNFCIIICPYNRNISCNQNIYIRIITKT